MSTIGSARPSRASQASRLRKIDQWICGGISESQKLHEALCHRARDRRRVSPTPRLLCQRLDGREQIPKTSSSGENTVSTLFGSGFFKTEPSKGNAN